MVGSLGRSFDEQSRRVTNDVINAYVLLERHGGRSGGRIIAAIVVLCMRMQAIRGFTGMRSQQERADQ